MKKSLVRMTYLAGMCALAIAGPAAAPGQEIEPRTITVDCTKGKSITRELEKLPGKALIVKVKGACTENVLITRDNVTLRPDGVGPGTLGPGDTTGDTIRIDGARRVVIEGFNVTGGRRAVVGVAGATFDLRNCTVQGAAGPDGIGVMVAHGSTGTIDACTVTGNRTGIAGAGSASVVVTSTTVEANLGTGIVGSRNAHVRVGQDLDGSLAARPVEIRNNGGAGVSVTDGSSGIVVAGTVRNNGGDGVFIGAGSNALVGIGSGGLLAGVAVRMNGLAGIRADGNGAVTVLGSTIADNASHGIMITNGSSGRIGIRGSAYIPNTVSGNGSIGIQANGGSSVFIGGTTVTGNGSNAASTSRFGIGVFNATATLVGGNLVEGNADTGVSLGRGATVFIGEPGHGVPTTNTISGNGSAGPTGGGVFVFEGAVLETRSGTVISGNHGAGVGLLLGGVADLRATVIGDNTGAGVDADLRSTVRLRDASVVDGNGGNGVEIGRGSAVDFRSGPVVTVNDNGGWGLQCFDAGSSHSGDISGIGPNGQGAIGPGCTGF
jgi:hypothetical protein